VPFGAVFVGLVLDGDILGDLQFEAAAQPQFMRTDGVVGDVVVGRRCPGIYRYGRNEITGEGVDC
jgi:hypothetical protein